MAVASLPLDPNSLPQLGCFIDNKYRRGQGKEWPLVNPKDAKTIQELKGASDGDVNDAVTAATRAFKSGKWAGASGAERGRWLNRLADLIEDERNSRALATYESLPSGRPISMVLRGDVPRVAQVFRYYAGWADKYKGDSYPPEDGFYKIVEQKPLGVCAAVTAWNGSLHFLAWKVAPALALGNTVIVKPSEKSPLGILAFGHLVQAAGFPAGVLNIVSGDGSIGGALASHTGIQKISFTGSLATGRKIQAAAAQSNLKRVTLELGGKSPGIIFEDANMDTAITWCVRGITINAGQICAATSRLLVHESIADTVITRLKQAFEAIATALGADPQEPGTTYGPVVDKAQYERVLEYIAEGEKSFESLVEGAKQIEGNGYYIAPRIFKNVDRRSRLYREEVFGPVLCIDTFETEADALEKANDTEFGLMASVFTNNLGRAIRFWRQIEAGTVCINCAAMVGPQVPNGGFKSSGLGRELGEYALHHYAEPRTIWINLGV